MKRIYVLFAFTVFITTIAFAGGIITNTNQSSSFVRMPSRNASTDIDAAYFNPAGIMKLSDGFHFSLSIQTLSQKREIENFYKGPNNAYGLNNSLYKGKIFAPVFPDFYGVYKKNKLAVSFGFLPVGGGGGGTYDKGLPSFEMAASDLVPALASSGAQGYRLDAYFKGTSVFYGYQLGISYKINDMFSVSGGIRYVMAKNTYKGHLNDIEINMAGTWTRADLIMSGIASQLSGTATSLQPIIDGGGANLTIAQAEGAGIITSVQMAQLEGGLAQLGVTNPSAMTITTVQQAYSAGAGTYNGTATLLHNQEADVEQTGSGFSPILSVNFSPNEKLNIAIKYEFATKLELKNKTNKDFTTGFDTITGAPITMFPDGQKLRNDLPAMLAAGISYAISPKLKACLSGNIYFDKSADYGHKIEGIHVKNSEIIDNNLLDFALGLEYTINEKILISGGYEISKAGVNEKYQSDLDHCLTYNNIGLGGAYSISKKIKVNLGAAMYIFNKPEKTIDHVFAANKSVIPARETYSRNTMELSLGVDFSF